MLLNDGQFCCWIFAYGSLCWHPGFEYDQCLKGHVRGFVRRFWQGNISHRGSSKQPGRVVTLVPATDGCTWGCAYHMCGPSAVSYLRKRECELGAYTAQKTRFYPLDVQPHMFANMSADGSIEAIAYIALAGNEQWMGPDTLQNIAQNIFCSKGTSGHNAEYLLRLAAYMREQLPEVEDVHLFELEKLVIDLISRHKVPLDDIMNKH